MESLFNAFPALTELHLNYESSFKSTVSPENFVFLLTRIARCSCTALRAVQLSSSVDFEATPLPGYVLRHLSACPPNLRYVVWNAQSQKHRAVYAVRRTAQIDAVETVWPRPVTKKWITDWTDHSVYDHVNGRYEY